MFARKCAANGGTGGWPLGKGPTFLLASSLRTRSFPFGARLSSCSMRSEEKLQLSLFTRLNAVEAELRAMKDLLAELKVNQDGLRRDRDEWRWRAERLLADQENGALWRWRRRTDGALDTVTASLSKLTIDLDEAGRDRAQPKRAAPARECLASSSRTPHPRSAQNRRPMIGI